MSEFDWTHPGLNWHHFHSLANLLALRNGGQAEASSLSTDVLEEDWNPDDDGNGDALSTDTNLAHQLSDSGHGRLKRRFLDCLAEFAANKKGGTAVACSAIKEAEDNVILWLARNTGFLDTDALVFDRLGEMLGSLSGNNCTSRAIFSTFGLLDSWFLSSRTIGTSAMGTDGLMSSEPDRRQLHPQLEGKLQSLRRCPQEQ